jgi:hypothetical protein
MNYALKKSIKIDPNRINRLAADILHYREEKTKYINYFVPELKEYIISFLPYE